MGIGEVKQVLYELTAKFHPNASIVWAKTKGVAPKPPCITLGYSNLERSAFPLLDEGGEHSYYYCSMGFEVNLYTAGREVSWKGKPMGAFENTAIEDMEEFIRFLDSEKITELTMTNEIAIQWNPPVRDLSELIGDTKYRYRAMAEFTVVFVQEADGAYGVSGMAVPNSSGGGTMEIAEAVIEQIEAVQIKEKEGS